MDDVDIIRFFGRKSPIYSILKSEVDSDDLTLPNRQPSFSSGPARTWWRIPIPLTTIWNCTSIAVFALGATMLGIALFNKPTDQQCAAQTGIWSPLLDAVEYEDKNFINYFTHQTIYRGPPTPEREQAWKQLTISKSVIIPYDKIGLLNRSADIDWERAHPTEGIGYIAGIEVFHYLHCLNLVRQYTWLEHYDPKPGGLDSSPVANRMHVDHCIETLRLALMCNADLTPFLVELDPSLIVGGRADFNAFHRCKKFEPLVDWMEQNAVRHPYNLSGLQHAHKEMHSSDSTSPHRDWRFRLKTYVSAESQTPEPQKCS